MDHIHKINYSELSRLAGNFAVLQEESYLFLEHARFNSCYIISCFVLMNVYFKPEVIWMKYRMS